MVIPTLLPFKEIENQLFFTSKIRKKNNFVEMRTFMTFIIDAPDHGWLIVSTEEEEREREMRSVYIYK